MLLPTMHGSLKASPAVLQNIERLRSFGVQWLAPRHEEGKDKFPDPESTADVIGHLFNRPKREGASIFITMGTTRGFIDEVRYLSNYSSGKLGSLVAEELYRQGFQTEVISGPCPHQPKSATHITSVLTNGEMEAAVRQAVRGGAQGGIFAASVLDFIPEKAVSGKLSSQDHPTLNVHLRRAEKIIGAVQVPLKVGFKLEVGLKSEGVQELAHTYIKRYGLSMMVVNDLKDVDDQRHRAIIFESEASQGAGAGAGAGEGEGAKVSRGVEVLGKMDLALKIVGHIRRNLEHSPVPGASS
jgi:phosphopantothenoylcysteine decarboxylase/phosphopantothenate--cysteine ligase